MYFYSLLQTTWRVANFASTRNKAKKKENHIYIYIYMHNLVIGFAISIENKKEIKKRITARVSLGKFENIYSHLSEKDSREQQSRKNLQGLFFVSDFLYLPSCNFYSSSSSFNNIAEYVKAHTWQQFSH